ncbi:MAG: lipopolysaccharide biosynthesis protein [Methylophilaceae bacterium]
MKQETPPKRPSKTSEIEDIKEDIAGDLKYAHRNTKRSSAAIRGAFWSAINSVVPTLLNSLVFIVTSRYLLPHDFGIVALAVSAVMLASAIAPAALGDAIIQQFNIRKSHLDTVFWFCFSSALILYGLLILLSPWIGIKMGQPSVSTFLPIIGLKLFFDLTAAVPNALIARSMSFHLTAIRTITATIVSSIICLTLLFSGYGIWALAISQLAVSITSCIAVFLGTKWIPGFDINLKALKELSKFGVFASGNRFLQTMNLDQLIVGTLIGATPLGIYNFARRLFQMLNDVIAGALNSVSMALLSSLQKEKEKVKEAFLFATFASSLVSFPAFVGLASVAGDAIPLVFGAHWGAAIWPTRWFCLIGLMSCIGVIQSSLINSQGKNNWWFYYQLFRQALTVLTIVLLFNKGITVIVMAMALQTVLFWPVTLLMVSKIIDLKISVYFNQFLQPFLASALMLAVVMLVYYLLQNSTPEIRLLSEIMIAGAIYALSIFVMCRERIVVICKIFLNRNKR